ncbi:hypothetical protein KC19_12G068100 [Ceratodon purpureus]|uniref:Uncharacterized protein n=1 Tax=Ceratodon purpureus TaxID=3225 RepID=A0A8T0G539_CERPU|nr:hypothetical protein KC19_12G068100 [Ceratodon purpureus]
MLPVDRSNANSHRSGQLELLKMSDAARSTRFLVSELEEMVRRTAEETDLRRKARLMVILAAVLVAGGAALVCTGAVVFLLVVPAVVVLSPLLLAVSMASLLFRKASGLWRRRSRSRDSSVVVEVGVWSVVSDPYKSDLTKH